ncbi:Modulator of drug activity B [Erwinia amylovora]|uniref:Modulator of drug activity B n=2 Tax=Erwinia amylovora TaxID=552 RepID=A0A830ZWP2_ERWAM|nr:Modulator of drug activity B [Erwinia amylovora]EKV55313.1 Modulator of drug activity B [Erwinia amylovora ACW56400]CBA19406.1 Modulator of drug activity B [Erwinia amylovora CFBP1430]CCO77306.1 Modulator of drug activity B [Erwinia amylovora Ea356]CCO81090.1 Modulator of drug activity B [Erwinia amylovora Ea266]CCO84895.1 Modulator of drug activity B [Erwinia amylovora CFBP 2585]CCO88681.1 Modulator of drug activity B [Erwinia amylovora 01SFR-BO]CCO92438.1 Modulator of drug activity B [E
MTSLTRKAPSHAFTDRQQFFAGVGVDGDPLHVHKAHRFRGMSGLPVFIDNGGFNLQDVASDIARYRTHLSDIFAKLSDWPTG